MYKNFNRNNTNPLLSDHVDAVIKNDKKVELHKISGIDGTFIGTIKYN